MENKFTKDNFQSEVLDYKEGPVLVDFFATWCGPCQALGPIIEELAKNYDGTKIKIGKVDIDQAGELAEKYNVMSVPTIIVFRNGEVKEELHGLQAKETLAEILEKNK